jgi:hypothetical protein
MILIAIALSFVILAIAALAIDLVALYSAHNDARAAADVAALAGAKFIANSGYTTDATTTPWISITAPAIAVAQAAGSQNKISGQAIPVASIIVTPSTGNGNGGNTNPQVAVTITSSSLPAFFSRIWGNTALSVAATATAEVYNPSGNSLPVQSQCVKPWLLPNIAPNGAGNSPLLDVATGQISAALPLVGTPYPLTLAAGCGSGCLPPPHIPAATKGSYYPVQLNAGGFSSTSTACTASSCEYAQNIAACSSAPISCGSQLTIETSMDACLGGFVQANATGIQCLIHASAPGPGAGQDCMGADASNCAGASVPSLATQFLAGDDNPLRLDGVNAGDLISTSDSVVTIPIFNQPAVGAIPNPVTVIGFVQGFVTDYGANGAFDIRIINVAGCGASVSGSPVQGDSISPVPVHLIGN